MISSVQGVQPYKLKAFLHQKYVTEQRSIAEIAAICVSSKPTIKNALRRLDIPQRSDSTSVRSVSHLRYGERIRHGRCVRSRKEADRIEDMREMRKNGLSYWKIAAQLNELRVPTKTGRGRWHARYVKKLLDM